ncbi:MAG TPA: rhodanese [Stenotrophomonas sp.]|nr:rhodanese [Stenotrophomonas sp.]
MPTPVQQFAAAPSAEAAAHFQRKLRFETDCWDVHASMAQDSSAFVLLDVRSGDLYAAGHVPGAINLPHGKIVAGKLHSYPLQTLFVVYCAGPHCNGADKAAARLAALGRPVKLMIGGVTGWLDKGFALASSPAPASLTQVGSD